MLGISKSIQLNLTQMNLGEDAAFFVSTKDMGKVLSPLLFVGNEPHTIGTNRRAESKGQEVSGAVTQTSVIWGRHVSKVPVPLKWQRKRTPSTLFGVPKFESISLVASKLPRSIMSQLRSHEDLFESNFVQVRDLSRQHQVFCVFNYSCFTAK